jgi:guanosine-3',5'-bis(diphosphate) 3'-pyrophosphohydrolase
MIEQDLLKIIKALSFAAKKHRGQKRRNKQSYPYINHPIEVVRLLTEVGGIYDADIICGAFLHDTVEDTDATAEEIEKEFGTAVKDYVIELTDDMSLPSKVRKQKQVDAAPHKSNGAKLIKLCDKISNITDIIYDPPVFWSHHRRLEYLDWSEQVVKGMLGTNANLEKLFFETLRKGRDLLIQ